MNEEQLSEKIVNQWDLETLLQFAIDHLQNDYKKDNDLFLNDLQIYKDSQN